MSDHTPPPHPLGSDEFEEVVALRIARKARLYFWLPLGVAGAVLALFGLGSVLRVQNATGAAVKSINDQDSIVSNRAADYVALFDSLPAWQDRFLSLEQQLERMLDDRRGEWDAQAANTLFSNMRMDSSRVTLAAMAESTASELERLATLGESLLDTIDARAKQLSDSLAPFATRVQLLNDAIGPNICYSVSVQDKDSTIVPAWGLTVHVGDLNPPREIEQLAVFQGENAIFGPWNVQRGFNEYVAGGRYILNVTDVLNGPEIALVWLCRPIDGAGARSMP